MSDLLNGFNNGRDKSDGIGGNKPIDQLANDVDTSESGLHLQNVMPRFKSNTEILKWLKEQNYQTEYEETGEYKMYYEIDMPKILTDFIKFLNGA